MKKCIMCGELKSVEDFGWQNSERKRRKNQCRVCVAAIHREYYKAHKERYRKTARQSLVRGRDRNRRFIYNYLLGHSCVDCNETDPVVLGFDHVRGDKQYGVSDMLSCNYSLARLKAEIAKCMVRCSNCHLRRHARERGFWVYRLSLEASEHP